MENLSKRKRDEMIAFLEFLKKQHSDDDSLMAINSIERELTAKKYGLIWEEHQEEVDKKMETHIPVFSEVPEYEVMEDEHNTTFNFLFVFSNKFKECKLSPSKRKLKVVLCSSSITSYSGTS